MLGKGITMALLTTTLMAMPARASDTQNLVETAAADHRLRTLTALVGKASLGEALAGKGPFTVFAPTNEAFARLEKEVLGHLLDEKNVEELRTVLKRHVVAGRFTSSDILGRSRVHDLSGEGLPFGLRVGNANVIQADLHASNGVVHLIDRVLLPVPPRPSPVTKAIDTLLQGAIDRGVPLYNDGEANACAKVYTEAARTVLRTTDEAGAALARRRLEVALADPGDAKSRAWALRRAFDQILADLAFEPRMEAELPKGFPEPSPVGAVVEKRYPAYRAARTKGMGSFWRLFRHIKKNDVAMTAPVELTLSPALQEVDMAFLYRSPALGEAGPDGSVEVQDLEPLRVLSVAMRGSRATGAVKTAKRLLESELERRGLEAAGAWRLLGYNSPMVPTAKRTWELQVPVR